MRLAIVAATVLFGLSVCGCKTHDELKVDVVCQTLCPCFASPAQLDDCLAECSAQLDPDDVSDACFSCVLEEADSCAALDDVCDPTCAAF